MTVGSTGGAADPTSTSSPWACPPRSATSWPAPCPDGRVVAVEPLAPHAGSAPPALGRLPTVRARPGDRARCRPRRRHGRRVPGAGLRVGPAPGGRPHRRRLPGRAPRRRRARRAPGCHPGRRAGGRDRWRLDRADRALVRGPGRRRPRRPRGPPRPPAEAASRLGAGEPTDGYDVVIEAAGTDSAMADAVSRCRPGGRVVLLASYWDGVVQLPGLEVTMKEVTLVPAAMYGRVGPSQRHRRGRRPPGRPARAPGNDHHPPVPARRRHRGLRGGGRRPRRRGHQGRARALTGRRLLGIRRTRTGTPAPSGTVTIPDPSAVWRPPRPAARPPREQDGGRASASATPSAGSRFHSRRSR